MIDVKSINLIKKHEGLRLAPYKDSEGILTVGYGHNLEKPITHELAHVYLQRDLNDVEITLSSFDWYDGLDPVRQAVVQNMVFNLGATRFSGFVKTINFIASGEYGHAATEMLDSKWATQVGKRASELSRMMYSGHWPA